MTGMGVESWMLSLSPGQRGDRITMETLLEAQAAIVGI